MRVADLDRGSVALALVRTTAKADLRRDRALRDAHTTCAYLLVPTGRLVVAVIDEREGAHLYVRPAGDLTTWRHRARRITSTGYERSPAGALAAATHIAVHSDIGVFTYRGGL